MALRQESHKTFTQFSKRENVVKENVKTEIRAHVLAFSKNSNGAYGKRLWTPCLRRGHENAQPKKKNRKMPRVQHHSCAESTINDPNDL